MKISELINALKQVRSVHGEVDVMLLDGDTLEAIPPMVIGSLESGEFVIHSEYDEEGGGLFDNVVWKSA